MYSALKRLNILEWMANSSKMSKFRIELLVFTLRSPILQFIGIMGALSLLFLTIDNQVQAITFANYTSDKYQIQFQYPSTWQLTEKQNRFEEGVDVQILGSTPYGLIMVQYVNFTDLFGMDFTELFYDLYKEDIGTYGKEIRVIEQPSFFNIDGQKAGTYLYTTKDKYEEYAVAMPLQKWIITAGDHGYFIGFSASINTYDSPDLKQVRDTLIKSMKFLGTDNSTNSLIPNRFQ
jgi:hypothetical protein